MTTLILLLALTGTDFRDLARPPSTSAVEPTAPAPAEVPLTGVCQCRGTNKAVCYCLQNGVKCKCSSVKGSVWNLNDAGRATSKTGEYANPFEVAVRDEKPKATETTGYPVTNSRGWNYWTDSNGQRWNDQGYGLSDGKVFTYQGRNRFVYGNGRMYEYGEAPESKPAAPKIEKPAIQRQSGRWVKRCYGGYCRMEWVPY